MTSKYYRPGWQTEEVRKKAVESIRKRIEDGLLPVKDYTPKINPDKERQVMAGVRYDYEMSVE